MLHVCPHALYNGLEVGDDVGHRQVNDVRVLAAHDKASGYQRTDTRHPEALIIGGFEFHIHASDAARHQFREGVKVFSQVVRQYVASHAVVLLQRFDDLNLMRFPFQFLVLHELQQPPQFSLRGMLASTCQVVHGVGVGRHQAGCHPCGQVQALLVRPGLHPLLATPLSHIQQKRWEPFEVCPVLAGDLIRDERQAVEQTQTLLHGNRRSALACAVVGGVAPDGCCRF